MDEPPAKVRCADCGFLSVWHTAKREHQEAAADFRLDGSWDGLGSAWIEQYAPVCFERIIAIPRNLQTTHPALVEERECRAFTPWQQGFTPKEHREMLDRDRMLKWQADREEADRKWRDDQRSRDEAWHADEARAADARHRDQLEVIREQHRAGIRVFGWFMAAAVVVATLLGSMIQAGWIAKPW